MVNLKGSINIDMDTLAEDLTTEYKTMDIAELRRITYKKLLPGLVNLLQKNDVPATFFVIGKDAVKNKKIIKDLSKEYEIANHTMNHNKQLVNLDEEKIKKEITEADKILADITGQKIVGFRAVGYTINKKIIGILGENNYTYDASLNTSLIYYLAKSLFRTFQLKDKEYITTQKFTELFSQNRIFKYKNGIVEIPINKIPILSYPLISSSLFFNKKISRLCYPLIKNQTLNFEIHIAEFYNNECSRLLKNGIFLSNLYSKIPFEKRLRFFDSMLKYFKENYKLKTLKEIAKETKEMI